MMMTGDGGARGSPAFLPLFPISSLRFVLGRPLAPPQQSLAHVFERALSSGCIVFRAPFCTAKGITASYQALDAANGYVPTHCNVTL